MTGRSLFGSGSCGGGGAANLESTDGSIEIEKDGSKTDVRANLDGSHLAVGTNGIGIVRHPNGNALTSYQPLTTDSGLQFHWNALQFACPQWTNHDYGLLSVPLPAALRTTLGLADGDPDPALGELAWYNKVDWTTQVINKPDISSSGSIDPNSLGSLAYKNNVDWTAPGDVINKPVLGTLAGKNALDYTSTDITNKPALGALALKDAVDWNGTGQVLNKPDLTAYETKTNLKTLAYRDGVDWNSATDVLNKPDLTGYESKTNLKALAYKDQTDYATDVTNKPVLGALAAKDTVDYGTDVTNAPNLALYPGTIGPSSASTYDLGSTARRWNTMYGNTLNVTNAGSNLVPTASSVYGLGSSTNRWAYVYTDAVTVYNGLTLAGSSVRSADHTVSGAALNGRALTINSTVDSASSFFPYIFNNPTLTRPGATSGDVSFGATLWVPGAPTAGTNVGFTQSWGVAVGTGGTAGKSAATNWNGARGIWGPGLVSTAGGVFPSTTILDQDVGNSTYRWRTVACQNLDFSGTLTGDLYPSVKGLIKAGTNASVTFDDTAKTITVAATGSAQPNLQAYAGDLIPSSTATYNLGSTAARWNMVYGSYLDVTKVASSLYPQVTGTQSLGSSALRWYSVYGTNLDFSGVLTGNIYPNVKPLIKAGTGVTVTADDAGKTLTVAATGSAQPTTSRTDWTYVPSFPASPLATATGPYTVGGFTLTFTSSTTQGGYEVWKGFDNNAATGFRIQSGTTTTTTGSVTGTYLGMQFAPAVALSGFRSVGLWNEATSTAITHYVFASNDGTTWTQVGTFSLTAGLGNTLSRYDTWTVPTTFYTYYRLTNPGSGANVAWGFTDATFVGYGGTGPYAAPTYTNPVLTNPLIAGGTLRMDTPLKVVNSGAQALVEFWVGGTRIYDNVQDGGGALELGQNTTVDCSSFVDFHGQAGSDFDARIIRGPGANGAFTLQNNGSGEIHLASGGGQINIDGAGWMYPNGDASQSLGYSNRRWNTVYASNGVVATSDENAKRDVQPLQDGLAVVEGLRPISFRFKEGDAKRHWGLGARATAATLGELGWGDVAVVQSDSDPWGMNYAELVAPLVGAVQELGRRVTELEARCRCGLDRGKGKAA